MGRLLPGWVRLTVHCIEVGADPRKGPVEGKDVYLAVPATVYAFDFINQYWDVLRYF